MTPLDDTIRATLIKQLSSGRNRNDVILELCQQQSLDWKQGEALVRDVENYDENHIVRRQSPLLLVLGLAVTCGGAVMAGLAIVAMWELIHMSTAEQLVHAGDLYGAGVLLVIGIAMIAGGVYGFRKVFSAWLN